MDISAITQYLDSGVAMILLLFAVRWLSQRIDVKEKENLTRLQQIFDQIAEKDKEMGEQQRVHYEDRLRIEEDKNKSLMEANKILLEIAIEVKSALSLNTEALKSLKRFVDSGKSRNTRNNFE